MARIIVHMVKGCNRNFATIEKFEFSAAPDPSAIQRVYKNKGGPYIFILFPPNLTRPMHWPSRPCALLSTASDPSYRARVRCPGPHCYRAQLCSSPLPPPPEPSSCSEPPFSVVHPRPYDLSPEPATEPWSTLCVPSTLPLLAMPSLH